MNKTWQDLVHGERWRSPDVLWVEEGTEHSWQEVDDLATSIERALSARGSARVVLIRSGTKLGHFAGQLGAWRAGWAAVMDDGTLGPDEIDRVRPNLSMSVYGGTTVVEGVSGTRVPDGVVAVNFTSGSTGSRKAVAVTRDNLMALVNCGDLDVPVDHRLTSGSFATPAFDGWWFDTWVAVAAGGKVVCLPNVNEDVFEWSDLVERHRVDRVLLPAAVIAALLDVLPEAIAGIPWVFSGGEQFHLSTYRRAREAGLTNRFVNLYGPTEATFATHKYVLPEDFTGDTIPIGRPLDGLAHRSRDLDGSRELVVEGPFVCLGYLEGGELTTRFDNRYRTGDVVQEDAEGNLVFAGRMDSRIKVNGKRVDAAVLEHEVTGVAGVSACRVAQHEGRTVAFAAVEPGTPQDDGFRARVESVVRISSTAIAVELVDRFPVKPGGKVDTAALLDHHLRETGV
ncbi:AMP-binding protein [Umezawaea sp. Da 62-37]|uniref:AMP-binding protein n=1 Tax=Umezawaea sp. Da 62-37 TaxID=3075927 RepID=UPI0028F74449|nr:AMP-binding protein [Umezawaea sp. Da 62-37]WNV87536.1 AMP-binding protein [Umezawaea sp. Da 62-37]